VLNIDTSVVWRFKDWCQDPIF